MRILQLIGGTLTGGAEAVAVNLARQLAKEGVGASVFALTANMDEPAIQLRRTLAECGVALRTGPPGAVRTGAVREYSRALRDLEPDIVHLHTPNTELAHALVPLRRPTAARTIHSTRVKRSLLYRWAYARNGVGRSVACSTAVAAANRDWASPVMVIRNGVEFSWPVRSPTTKAAATTELGLEAGRIHVVMVGAMRGESLHKSPKAHDIAIAAWKLAGVAKRGAQLHLVGDGPFRPLLAAMVTADDQIYFHGVSGRVPLWLQAADVFLMPSRYEGMPMVGIEALGTGLPCVFSDIPSLRELEPDSVLWSKPGDIESLASMLKQAAHPGFCTMGQDTARIRNEFGVESMVTQYLAYYDVLLAGAYS